MSDIQAVTALISEGKFQEAHQAINSALEREPLRADGWYLKGIICSRFADLATAINCFNQALQLKPDFREAALSLGRTLAQAGQPALAIKVFEHTLGIDLNAAEKKANPPAAVDHKAVQSWFHKGEMFQQQGDARQAADAFRHVLALQPDLPEALINLGLALHRLRQFGEAEMVLLHCLRLSPGNPHALNILAGNYAVSGEVLRAIVVWRQLVAHDPGHYDALVNLAKAFSSLELYDEAIKAYEQALALRAESPEILLELLHMLSRLCRWKRAGEIMTALRTQLKASPTWMEQFLVSVHLPELQLNNARRYVKHKYPAGVAYDGKRPLPADSRGDGRLCIGYVSSDFYQHATAYLISELFEQHDKERFEIIAYSYGKNYASAERSRIEKAVNQFRDIQTMDDATAASLVRHDGIDILVDLKGYTTGSRMGLMATRASPLQMHYLGHPGTLGAPFIDYFIADSVAAPQSADADFSEKLIRLPHSYQINDRKRPLPEEALPRSACGLPEGAFVFAGFNLAYKITPEVFAVWMRLLAGTPGSVLWLYETNAEATANMRNVAAKHGVESSRIVTAQPVPLAQHLVRYRHVDLFLDTSPVCGHTTASDALWCGVPVVTIAGKVFISRVAASLLSAVELPELITPDLQAYETLAFSLANDSAKLSRLRRHLEEGRMHFPLFDSKATTQALETAYLHAVGLHRASRAPQAFALAPDLSVREDQ